MTDLLKIINAGDTRPGNFHTHARGVAAILQIENSPVDLFGAVHFLRSNHSVIFKGVPVSFVRYSALWMCVLNVPELWDIFRRPNIGPKLRPSPPSLWINLEESEYFARGSMSTIRRIISIER